VLVGERRRRGLLQPEPPGPVGGLADTTVDHARSCPLSRSRPCGTPRPGRRTPRGRSPVPAAGRGWPQLGHDVRVEVGRHVVEAASSTASRRTAHRGPVRVDA
jgi:hypothetical protein